MIHEYCRWLSKWPGEARPGGRRAFLAALASAAAVGRAADVSPFDLSLLDAGVTPAELFFVREHFAAPAVEPVGWRLSVTSEGREPWTIRHADFVKLPRRVIPATIECAENPVGGGLVSHAEWEGVPLAAVLESAGRALGMGEAKFLRLRGADGFAHTLPASKALHADTLLAFRMNGESLPPGHGGPVRAVSPGWYGVASIKWLDRVELLLERPAEATGAYHRQPRSLLAGVTIGEAVTQTLVKSVFSRPLDGATLFGQRFTLRGAAWAGERAVRAVEVTTDGGRTWMPAKLEGNAARYAWSQWSLEWRIPSRGSFELAVRATDDTGAVQPAEREEARVDGYELNQWHRIQVTAA